MPNLGTPELVIILVLVLLVFGGAKLPKLARSLGQAQREFKSGLSENAAEGEEPGSEAGRSSRGDKAGGASSSTNGAA